MPVINVLLMLFNSFQFRLILAELLFCLRFRLRRMGHLVLAIGIVLLLSFPAIVSAIRKNPFYAMPNILWNGYNFSFLIIFISSLVFIFSCFDVTSKELLFLGAGAYIVQNLIYDVLWAAKLLFFPSIITYSTYAGFDVFSANRDLLIYNVLCVLLLWFGLAITYVFLISRWNKNHEIYIGQRRLIAFLLFTILILNVISSIASEECSTVLFVPVLLAITSGLLLLIQFNVFDLHRLQHEKELESYIYRSAESQHKRSEEEVALINMKAHDLKHTLEAIKQETAAGMVERELCEAEQAVSEFNSIVQTGNKALDTILTEKNLLCVQNEIEFTFIADGDALSFMELIDIYVILGNALDNAIERLQLEQTEYRIMSLKIARKGDGVFLSLENFCSERLEFKDGLPQTVKQDKTVHGFGMKSIRTVVEKYGGHMVVRQQHDMFILNIMLPIQGALK